MKVTCWITHLVFLHNCCSIQIFVMWLDLVTYLHHHGHDEKLPWYRGEVCHLLNNAHWFFRIHDFNHGVRTISEYLLSTCFFLLGMELPSRRTYNNWSRFWIVKQHPSWHRNSWHSPSFPSNSTLLLIEAVSNIYVFISSSLLSRTLFFTVFWHLVWICSCRQKQQNRFLRNTTVNQRNMDLFHYT